MLAMQLEPSMVITRTREGTYTERRKAAGWRKITIWLDPDTDAALKQLPQPLGEQEAIRTAIEWAHAARKVVVDAPYAEVES